MVSRDKASLARFRAQGKTFRFMYFAIAWIQALTVPILLSGQTMGVFFYDWAAAHGLQERREDVGELLPFGRIHLSCLGVCCRMKHCSLSRGVNVTHRPEPRPSQPSVRGERHHPLRTHAGLVGVRPLAEEALVCHLHGGVGGNSFLLVYYSGVHVRFPVEQRRG